jgi:glycosyltransferase involved in cell wall biosynthesis
MRILHLTDRASARGGADVNLNAVLSALHVRHEVCLAAGRIDPGFEVAGLGFEVRVVPGLDDLRHGPEESDLDELLASWRPDRVHVHNAIGARTLGWVAARGGVATVQDHRGFCPGRGKWTLDGAVCREPMSERTCRPCFDDVGYFARVLSTTQKRLEALREMRGVAVLSEYMAAELAAAGVSRERVEVVRPFVDPLPARVSPSGPPCVLFVGRLVESKGVAAALDAWQRSGVELPLVMAGTGTLRVSLEDAGLEVTGWVPQSEMAAVYARAAAVLVPSLWQEPFGIVGLEALAHGVPVAAWRSGGVAEWHTDRELLVEWGDVDALARALAKAVEGRAARYPAGFTRGDAVARLEGLYARVGPVSEPDASQ